MSTDEQTTNGDATSPSPTQAVEAQPSQDMDIDVHMIVATKKTRPIAVKKTAAKPKFKVTPAARIANGAPTKKRQPVSGSTRAGLVFPVGRTRRFLREETVHDVSRIRVDACVYLAAVCQAIAVEVIDASHNEVTQAKRKIIQARDVKLAVGNDDELTHLFTKHASMPSAGAFPTATQRIAGKQATRAKKIEIRKKAVAERNEMRGAVAQAEAEDE